MTRKTCLFSSIALAMTVPLAARAQETTPAAPAPAPDVDGSPMADPYRDTVTAGLGMVYLPDYEGSNDYRAVPAPGVFGSIDGYAFLLAGNQLTVDLVRDRPGPVWDVEAGPVVNVNFNRSTVGGIRDPRVKALGSVGTAIELGGYVGIGKTGVLTSPYDRLAATLSYRRDVAGAHDAGIWLPAISYFTPLSTTSGISLFGSAEIVEAGYARTYYSVSQAGSTASGLPVYAARGGLKSWTIGLIGTQSLTGDLLHGVKLVGGGTYGRMTGSIGDSPLVTTAGARDQWLGTIGLAYTF